ncbi:hypothetical protein EGW08_014777 [Elysia chlorotica]|uniref:N-acetyltransferase domain-containing protein n=1 Tax=Elysia chlorotica TaxID=188477 RepID=A0A433T7A3_ELYCH|nr:hypothetical protein EGW08_014777 [Elysia chlorotica]
MSFEMPSSEESFVIRKADARDSCQIYSYVQAMAKFHKANLGPNQSPENFRKGSMCQVLVVTTEADRSTILGYMLFHRAYSTWMGPVLYLEDLYISAKHRRKGLGRRLFQSVLQIGRDEKCKGMRMTVHTWNKQAKNLWEGLGCENLTETRHEHFYYYRIHDAGVTAKSAL